MPAKECVFSKGGHNRLWWKGGDLQTSIPSDQKHKQRLLELCGDGKQQTGSLNLVCLLEQETNKTSKYILFEF